MKIPLNHYLYFWLTNSIMASATGLLTGYMALMIVGAFFLKPHTEFPAWIYLLMALAAFSSYQCIVLSYFSGRRRGEFEYSFLLRCTEHSRHVLLSVRLKTAKRELKRGDPNAAHSILKLTTMEYPDDFVAHFEYAMSCERVGLAEDAIASYQMAEGLIPQCADALYLYVEKQIDRVKVSGPSNISTAPGLQYVLY